MLTSLPPVCPALCCSGVVPGSDAAQQAEAARKLKQLATECQGDHLLLLHLYQLWAAAGFSREFVKSYGLDLRGMNFARDIRKQLAGRSAGCNKAATDQECHPAHTVQSPPA